MSPPLVLVRWGDALHPTGDWTDPDDLEDLPVLVETAGFLVKETEHMLWIAASVDMDETGAVRFVSGQMGVPKGMVVSRRNLR